MLTSAISNVTACQVASHAAAKYKKESRSTITPFEKVLQTEEHKNENTVRVKKADTTVNTDTASGKRNVPLKDIFERASEKYDISYDFLVAVAKAESDFNTKCVSSAGAKGIMQLMPDECKEFGVKDPYDAEQNIMASAKLLKAHLKKFKGDYILAAAAYNAGSGAVRKYGGVPPYTETQNYVKKIKKFMQEGVKVPDKMVKVGKSESSEGGGGATSVSAQTGTTDTSVADFDKGEAATEADLEGITITVGSGDAAVTMTYGAYLKYLELGSIGVG